MSSKSLLIGIVTGLAVVAAGVVFVLTQPAPSKNKKTTSSPPLPKATMIAIFSKITEMMHAVVLKLAEVEQQVRASAAQQGKQLTQDEMEQYLLASFRQAMSEVEQAVYREFQTSEEQVQAATEFFEDDSEFQAILNKLKNLFRAVTGQGAVQEPTVEVPDHIDQDVVLRVYGESMEGLSTVIETVHAELTESGIVPGSAEFQSALQATYVERFGVLRLEILESHSMSEVSLNLYKV